MVGPQRRAAWLQGTRTVRTRRNGTANVACGLNHGQTENKTYITTLCLCINMLCWSRNSNGRYWNRLWLITFICMQCLQSMRGVRDVRAGMRKMILRVFVFYFPASVWQAGTDSVRSRSPITNGGQSRSGFPDKQTNSLVAVDLSIIAFEINQMELAFENVSQRIVGSYQSQAHVECAKADKKYRASIIID